jgi:zinc protease
MSGADLPGGRLHARLRDNQLVYVVHAYDSPGLDDGMFVIYAATQKSNLETVQSIIDEEVLKVKDADISDEELARAKSMCIAAHAIDTQTNSALSREAASDELYGLGYKNNESYAARINAITLADVRAMAQKYLVPEHAALAIVEPK